MSDRSVFRYGVDRMTVATALSLVSGRLQGVLDGEARARVAKSHQRVAELAAGDQAVYGVNTGFGPLCTTRISPADTRQLQYNLLRSHSSGMGEPVTPQISKLMLILKAQALSRGHSGVSPDTIERILVHIEENLIPVVPSQGSVGASGDLAPLSHLFLSLIGEGTIWEDGSIRPAAAILAKRNLAPLTLGPKEALALINGTQFMAAHGLLAVFRLQACLDMADIAGAMSLEALSGSVRPFDESLHGLRPHSGVVHVAAQLRNLLAGSEMILDHVDCPRVQDPYSLRCMPQVHGASREAWLHLRRAVEIEINAVTDNPVILESGEAVSGGHFHGQPLALPLDYASLAASELGNIADRRIFLLLLGNDRGLPRLLMKKTGLQSGFMIPQYTSAALVTENKTLCFPASADSIPTSLGQEDHVSMGSVSGRKLHRILDNLERIQAVEFLCTAQGIDFRRPLRSTPTLEAVHACIRREVSHAEDDRIFGEDLAKVEILVRSGALLDAAREAEGKIFGKTGGDFRLD